MPTNMTITQELRLFLNYTPDQMRDLKQTGRVSDRLYRHYCFIWLWSAWRQDYRHERFYKRMGSAAYWRRIDRVRRLFLRIAEVPLPEADRIPFSVGCLNP